MTINPETYSRGVSGHVIGPTSRVPHTARHLGRSYVTNFIINSKFEYNDVNMIVYNLYSKFCK